MLNEGLHTTRPMSNFDLITHGALNTSSMILSQPTPRVELLTLSPCLYTINRWQVHGDTIVQASGKVPGQACYSLYTTKLRPGSMMP